VLSRLVLHVCRRIAVKLTLTLVGFVALTTLVAGPYLRHTPTSSRWRRWTRGWRPRGAAGKRSRIYIGVVMLACIKKGLCHAAFRERSYDQSCLHEVEPSTHDMQQLHQRVSTCQDTSKPRRLAKGARKDRHTF
jgi:hypothetical protein